MTRQSPRTIHTQTQDQVPVQAQAQAQPLRDLPLKEITERWPLTLTVFHQYGMDACCGGMLSLANAARIHELDISELEAQLATVLPASDTTEG